jgi:hypothetical protein
MTEAERAKLYRDRKKAAERAKARAANVRAAGTVHTAEDVPAGPVRLRAVPRPARAAPPKSGSGIDPDTGAWSPVFPGQRPPWNGSDALQSGVRSPARVAELAGVIAAGLLTEDGTPDYLRDPSYRYAVQAWARHEAVCSMAWDWLAEQPDIEAVLSEITSATETEKRTGKVVKRSMHSRRVMNVLDVLGRHGGQAAKCREQLGLTPLGRARLGKAVTSSAVDLAQLMSAITERREQRALEPAEPAGQLGQGAAVITPADAGIIPPGGMSVTET